MIYPITITKKTGMVAFRLNNNCSMRGFVSFLVDLNIFVPFLDKYRSVAFFCQIKTKLVEKRKCSMVK